MSIRCVGPATGFSDFKKVETASQQKPPQSEAIAKGKRRDGHIAKRSVINVAESTND